MSLNENEQNKQYSQLYVGVSSLYGMENFNYKKDQNNHLIPLIEICYVICRRPLENERRKKNTM